MVLEEAVDVLAGGGELEQATVQSVPVPAEGLNVAVEAPPDQRGGSLREVPEVYVPQEAQDPRDAEALYDGRVVELAEDLPDGEALVSTIEVLGPLPVVQVDLLEHAEGDAELRSFSQQVRAPLNLGRDPRLEPREAQLQQLRQRLLEDALVGALPVLGLEGTVQDDVLGELQLDQAHGPSVRAHHQEEPDHDVVAIEPLSEDGAIGAWLVGLVDPPLPAHARDGRHAPEPLSADLGLGLRAVRLRQEPVRAHPRQVNLPRCLIESGQDRGHGQEHGAILTWRCPQWAGFPGTYALHSLAMSAFQHLAIHLAHPICTCPTQALAWGVDTNGQLPCPAPTLVVWYTICNERLIVPNDELDTAFLLAVPYPGVSKVPSLSERRRSTPPSSQENP